MTENGPCTYSLHKRWKLFVGLFTLLIASGLLVGTATLASAAPAPTCKATYTAPAVGDAGFTDQFTITNTSTKTLHKWHVQILFVNRQVIIDSWGGIFTQRGDSVLIKSTASNATVRPGSSVAPGFSAVWNNNTPYDATSVKLNGVTCSLTQP
jgi:hypothetical protein